MLNKIRSNDYLKASIVLTIDVITSLVASGLVLILCTLLGATLSPLLIIFPWLVGAFIASIIAFYATRIYRSIIRYSTLHEFVQMCFAVACKELIMSIVAGWMIAARYISSPALAVVLIALDFFITVAAMLLIRVLMLMVYRFLIGKVNKDMGGNRVLIYGTDEKAASTFTRLRHSPHYQVVGFLAPGKPSDNKLLLGLPVLHFHDPEEIIRMKEKMGLSGLLFAHHADLQHEKDRLLTLSQKTALKVFVAPEIDEVTNSSQLSRTIRKIKIEDLLGRPEIKIPMEEVKRGLAGKVVMVTGAAGSIGSELCRQLAGLGVSRLIMLDNAETPLHNVRLEFEDKYPWLNFVPVIGDVRSRQRLDYIFRHYHPQVVFHAAAYKHVPLMEENPCEAVLVNVDGSRNVADKCVEYDVEKMVMVSTDKAVNPTNIMGCTKRLAEIYVQSLGLALEKGLVKGKTTFVTTRFGNVLGSNGSVIPRFTEQIERGGPVTVTDPEIRRFFMTIPEACRLVMDAATIATGTHIYVFDMGTSIKIADLAKRMIHLAGYRPDIDINIEYTGLRPGEKLYEEVLATKENTLPTSHKRIFVAKVREYEYETARKTMLRLKELSEAVDVQEMVITMKRTVPEFKSKHSVFEKYDVD
ncbi:MAG: polysaccharide biosynthesis protein [Bacteroidales bacterium]|nr:polysaccharide biosynthesis protein [Bacteroidales bacterium]MBD5222214.1 polysaccharide biosynthesis protein [Bacteroidales bacterium]